MDEPGVLRTNHQYWLRHLLVALSPSILGERGDKWTPTVSQIPFGGLRFGHPVSKGGTSGSGVPRPLPLLLLSGPQRQRFGRQLNRKTALKNKKKQQKSPALQVVKQGTFACEVKCPSQVVKLA